jgi:hypothetical protein
MAVDGLRLDVYDADQAKAILEDLVAVYIEIYEPTRSTARIATAGRSTGT